MKITLYNVKSSTSFVVVSMDLQKEVISELSKMGMNHSQALTYLALLQNGEMRIQQIANATNTPRSSVYENIHFLTSQGLVEKVIESNFSLYKALSFTNLEHTIKSQLNALEFRLNEVDNMNSKIEQLIKQTPTETTVLRYYRGVNGARQLFWNTLQAKDTIRVYSAYGRSKFVGKKFYKDFVSKSHDLNIKERVLINPTKRALELITQDTGTSLARTKKENIRFLPENTLTIHGETFIYDNIYAQITLDSTTINGFEIESTDFVKSQRSIFDTLWKMAPTLSQILS